MNLLDLIAHLLSDHRTMTPKPPTLILVSPAIMTAIKAEIRAVGAVTLHRGALGDAILLYNILTRVVPELDRILILSEGEEKVTSWATR